MRCGVTGSRACRSPNADGRLVGILTNRDLRFCDSTDQPIRSELMTSEGLVTVPVGTTLDAGQGTAAPPPDRKAAGGG